MRRKHSICLSIIIPFVSPAHLWYFTFLISLPAVLLIVTLTAPFSIGLPHFWSNEHILAKLGFGGREESLFLQYGPSSSYQTDLDQIEGYKNANLLPTATTTAIAAAAADDDDHTNTRWRAHTYFCNSGVCLPPRDRPWTYN